MHRYGDVVPKTNVGKVLCVLYAFSANGVAAIVIEAIGATLLPWLMTPPAAEKDE